MRFMTRRLTTSFAALALAGVTVLAQTPPVQHTVPQTPPVPQTSPAQPTATAEVQPVPCVSSLPGLSDAAAMLDHIESILNDAVGTTPVEALAKSKAPMAGAVGTSGATANKVEVDREKLDEIRAEIAQITVIVKR